MIRRLLPLAIALLLIGPAHSAEPPWIFGMHDPGAESLAVAKGKKIWIVFTEEIGHDPANTSGRDYRGWSNAGHGVIVRLNNGYGSAGTLPVQSKYADFAKRCANYVAASQGCDIWIIGNETNGAREWPGNVDGNPATGEAITVSRYIDCYTRVYQAIKQVRSSAQVCPSPAGTYGPPYPDRGIEGFLDYWRNILNGLGPDKVDALILHAYTHGCDPALVTSDAKMGPPYQDIYYNFRVYKNYMGAVPTTMRAKPAYITECDQNVECADPPPVPRHAWYNQNNGWMKAVYAEIDNWNRSGGQKIRCVAMFRWPDVQEGEWSFGISPRQNVVQDWVEALSADYRWAATGQLAGYVRGADGNPVSGAVVVASPGGQSATSNSSGAFQITSLPPATYNLTATAPGKGSQTLYGKQVVADGVTTVTFILGEVLSPGAARKNIADGSQTAVSGVVTARFPATGSQVRFYLQRSDRSSGIWVNTSVPVVPGEEVVAQGAMATSSGERRITGSYLSFVRADHGPGRPLLMNNLLVGGGKFGLQPAMLNWANPVSYAIGLTNVGLLVKTWGRVTHIDPLLNYFYIDDGAVLEDGSGVRGVRVLSNGLTAPATGTLVSVTGISSAITISGKPVRALRPRNQSDIGPL